MTYLEKLKDPRWQKKRLEILERDEWMCQRCFDGDSTLHVHHLDYEKGKEPWDYDNSRFITICESCHETEHTARKEYEQSLLSIIKSKGFMADDVFSLVTGFHDLKMTHPPEVTASIIEFALSDGFQEVTSLFWDYTKKKADLRREASK
jgi:hypothetical protein